MISQGFCFFRLIFSFQCSIFHSQAKGYKTCSFTALLPDVLFKV
uniref:Uncharacterized protein n=1 Tax=Myoviridae sp. ctsip2 TaxID=2826705 RepID=A0A8S5N6T3_9CAUD|nr:MAG TPA: hypothetical protein [Myoviridae sp. ctsip2]